MNRRRITCTLGAVAGGLLAAAFLPLAVASADLIAYEPDPTTFDPTQHFGLPPLFDVAIGDESWNAVDLTNGTVLVPDIADGSDTHTTLLFQSITNDDFVVQLFNDSTVPAGQTLDFDYTQFGGGFANEFIDESVNNIGQRFGDVLITPFGDFPLIGADLFTTPFPFP